MDGVRVIPNHLEAEQSVIGGLMLLNLMDDEKADRVFRTLREESFYIRPHQLIFRYLLQLTRAKQNVDLITLAETMERSGDLEKVGGFAYLAEMSKNTPSAANIVAYANIVNDRHLARTALSHLSDLTELFFDQNSMTAAEKVERVGVIASRLMDAAQHGNRQVVIPLQQVMEGWLEELNDRFDPTKGRKGLSTGLGSLDDLLGVKKVVRGSLFVVGARPKAGKTTFYTQMALGCATLDDEPVVMFTLEMSDRQMLEKIAAQQGRIDPNLFYPDVEKENYGYLRGDYDTDLTKAMAVLNALAETQNIFIGDVIAPDLAIIRQEARRIKRERGKLGMVLVDYLTLMKPEKADRNDLAYALVTKGLKALARELDCVVVLLTQLNRGSEQRADKRPRPSDSRETGQIEQDCDYWLGIHRPNADDPDGDQSVTELLLSLNRHGEAGMIYARQIQGRIEDVNQEQYRQEHQRRTAPARKNEGF